MDARRARCRPDQRIRSGTGEEVRVIADALVADALASDEGQGGTARSPSVDIRADRSERARPGPGHAGVLLPWTPR